MEVIVYLNILANTTDGLSGRLLVEVAAQLDYIGEGVHYFEQIRPLLWVVPQSAIDQGEVSA